MIFSAYFDIGHESVVNIMKENIEPAKERVNCDENQHRMLFFYKWRWCQDENCNSNKLSNAKKTGEWLHGTCERASNRLHVRQQVSHKLENSIGQLSFIAMVKYLFLSIVNCVLFPLFYLFFYFRFSLLRLQINKQIKGKIITVTIVFVLKLQKDTYSFRLNK